MCELVEEYAEKRAKRYAEEREMQVKMRKNVLNFHLLP